MSEVAQAKVQRVLEGLLELAAGKLDARITVSEDGEPVDLIAAAINMLAEELAAAQTSERALRQELELEVSRRNAELEDLARANEQIAAQSEAIRALSTPVIEVWAGILILPLIGVVDAHRGEQLIGQLLESIRERGAKVAILDITGISAIDEVFAVHLARAIRASKLLGARVILTGVGPRGAMALLELDLDLGELPTEGSLAAGLRQAMTYVSRAP